MKYTVLKPFRNIDGAFLRVNDIVELDLNRARPLIFNRMIGNYSEKAINRYQVPEVYKEENAIEKKPKRKYRKRIKE